MILMLYTRLRFQSGPEYLIYNLDVKEAFLQDNTILSCNCAGYSFIDKDHQYAENGDLRIVGRALNI